MRTVAAAHQPRPRTGRLGRLNDRLSRAVAEYRGNRPAPPPPLPPDVRVILGRSTVLVVRYATGRTQLGEGDRCIGTPLLPRRSRPRRRICARAPETIAAAHRQNLRRLDDRSGAVVTARTGRAGLVRVEIGNGDRATAGHYRVVEGKGGLAAWRPRLPVLCGLPNRRAERYAWPSPEILQPTSRPPRSERAD